MLEEHLLAELVRPFLSTAEISCVVSSLPPCAPRWAWLPSHLSTVNAAETDWAAILDVLHEDLSGAAPPLTLVRSIGVIAPHGRLSGCGCIGGDEGPPTRRLLEQHTHYSPAGGWAGFFPLLSRLSTLSCLRELSLPSMVLSHAQLLALEAVPELTALDVTDTVCAAWREAGRPAPPCFSATLKRLACSGAALASRWRRAGAVFSRLTDVTMSALDYSCLSFFWAKMPGTASAVVTAAAAGGLASAPPLPPPLRHLTLISTRVCALRGPAWRLLTSGLESLAFTDCDLRPRPMLQQCAWQVLADILGDARGLRELRLRGEGMRPRVDAEFLRGALACGAPPQLTTFELAPASFLSDGAAMLLLAQVPVLENLRLSGALLLGEATLRALPSLCPRLRALCLCGARGAGDSAVRALTAAEGLEALDVSGSAVFSSSTFVDLAISCTNLTTLRMRGMHEAAAALAPPPLAGEEVAAAIRASAGSCLGSCDSSGGGAAVARAIADAAGFPVSRRSLAVTYTYPPPSAPWQERAVMARACSSCGVRLAEPADAADHEQACSFIRTACPLAADGCRERPRRQDVGAHLAVCTKWLTVCPGCGEDVPRANAAAHAAAHAARREALATTVRCPLAGDGCTWIERSSDRKNKKADGGIESHLRTGSCAAATYVCMTCGADTGAHRTVVCAREGCAEEARRRASASRAVAVAWRKHWAAPRQQWEADWNSPRPLCESPR